jgi:hypothetical protein
MFVESPFFNPVLPSVHEPSLSSRRKDSGRPAKSAEFHGLVQVQRLLRREQFCTRFGVSKYRQHTNTFGPVVGDCIVGDRRYGPADSAYPIEIDTRLTHLSSRYLSSLFRIRG